MAIAGFGLALGLFGAVEWAARRPGSRIPPLRDVCAVVVRYRVGRVPVGGLGLLSLWWWLGWHFLAR